MHSRKKYDAAVALRYQPDRENAPRVVAQGKGRIAEKIIRIAQEHQIHVHADPDLVAVLSQLELSSEIPPQLYAVVAEVLAFVYALNQESENIETR